MLVVAIERCSTFTLRIKINMQPKKKGSTTWAMQQSKQGRLLDEKDDVVAVFEKHGRWY